MSIEVAKLFVSVGADISGLNNGLGSAEGRLKSFESEASHMGTALTLALTAPLVMVGKSAVDSAAKFGTGMNVMQAVTGATGKEMERMRGLAIELGKDLTLPATSAIDASEAMIELAKAGLSVNDTMGAAKGVLQMSVAGNLSNAEAAKIAANALNMFNLKGTEAVHVADLLAAGANTSSAEIVDMADSLKMGGSVFAMTGMTIEDLTTSITIMANQGIRGRDAGTSLKQMLLSLAGPTEKARDLMQSLGIQIYDSSGSMLPMRDLIASFSERLGGLSEAQRNAALATIFGSDAIRAANIVMMGGVDAYDKMYAAVDRTGAASELAGARMKGLGGAIEAMKSSVETASLVIGEALGPKIMGLAKIITDAANGFSEWDKQSQDAAVNFAIFAAAIGPVVLTLGKVAQVVGMVGGAMKVMLPIMQELAMAAAGQQTAWLAINPTIAGTVAALGPLALIIAAVGAVTWGTIAATNAMEEAQNRESEAARKTAAAYKEVHGTLDGVYKTLLDQRGTAWWEGQQLAAQKTAKEVAYASGSYDEFAEAVKDAALASAGGMGVVGRSHEQAATETWKMVQAEKTLAWQVGMTANQSVLGNALAESGYVSLSFSAAQYAAATAENVTQVDALSAAEREATDAKMSSQAANELLAASLSGTMGDAWTNYVQAIRDANQAYAEGRIGMDELSAAQGTAEEALRRTTAEFIFQKAAADMDAAAALELARGMGLVDEKSYAVAKALGDAKVQYDTNRDGAIDAAEANAGYSQKVLDLQAAVNSLQSKGIEVTMNSLAQYMSDLDNLERRITTMPDRVVNVTVHENYDRVSTGGLSGTRASGGWVGNNQAYLVGERGPEIFVPKISGTIIPNNKLSAGGTTINLGGITISGNADSSTVKQAAYNGVMAAARAMGAM